MTEEFIDTNVEGSTSIYHMGIDLASDTENNISETPDTIENSVNISGNISITNSYYFSSTWNVNDIFCYEDSTNSQWFRSRRCLNATHYEQEYLGNWPTNGNYYIRRTDNELLGTYYTIDHYSDIELSVPERTLKHNKLKSNLVIMVKSRALSPESIPENEWRAIQTLRDMISESSYRKYLKDGFLMVQGDSGKCYQLFKNRTHTKVYQKGTLIEEICVRLKGNMPPTDNVIAFKTLIETNEEHFASLGNRYKMKQVA